MDHPESNPSIPLPNPDPCVGRDGELETISSLHERAERTRTGHVVLISGPSGAGKSHLAAIWAEKAGARGDCAGPRAH